MIDSRLVIGLAGVAHVAGISSMVLHVLSAVNLANGCYVVLMPRLSGSHMTMQALSTR